MNIIMSKKQVLTDKVKPFTPTFDRVYVSTDESFEDNNDFELKEKNIKKLFDVINFSWDGEIYCFKNSDKEKILSLLDIWFANKENHTDIDEDIGISNCFLVKETLNHLVLIDTQLDMSSNINSFISELEESNPNIEYEYYSDSHLIDNLYLGRGSMNDEFKTMYLLYKEKVIDSSFFFFGLAHIDGNEEYLDLLKTYQNKEIVMTGKFPYPREDITTYLQDLGYSVSEKVTENSWLWMGDNVGEKKIQEAVKKGIPYSTIPEIIDLAFDSYLKAKIKINKAVKSPKK